MDEVQRPVYGSGETPYNSAIASTCVARSGLFFGKRSSRCRNCSNESTRMELRLASILGLYAGTLENSVAKNHQGGSRLLVLSDTVFPYIFGRSIKPFSA
ncbi:hypothetical protein ALQ60_200234 [Pseudomonas syringae pv. papulans]|nr:hypothetical protein ALQ60_200234 [Pseudomonas syringae pv. papulans]